MPVKTPLAEPPRSTRSGSARCRPRTACWCRARSATSPSATAPSTRCAPPRTPPRPRTPGRQVEFVAAADLVVEGDPELLRLLLDNLLGNAWKFTGKQPAAHIELGCEDTGGGPACYVRDNGAGFDMALADRLFAPFKRLHTAAEFGGTGIGLATVQRIVRRHGGRIWAESAPSRGTTFHFTLPPASPSHAAAAAP